MRVASAALLLALFPSLVRAGTFVAFGPQEYVRQTGEPAPQTKNFTALDLATTYTLEIDSSGVASAVVTLNGVEVFKPSDFNSNVRRLSKPVTLRADNELTVELRGKPGESLTLRVVGTDNTPPLISALVTPEPNAAGWHTSDPIVTFNCSDATSGMASCTPPIIVSTESAGQVIVGTAVDKAGNTATASVTVRLDKTPPSISHTVSPAPNAAGWNNSDPTVTFNCSDAISGVASCTEPVIVTAETAARVVAGTATDQAGNTAAASVTVRLDKTPPDIDVTSPAADSTVFVSPVSVVGTLGDALSGLASVNCNGTPATVDGARFSCNVGLAPGANQVGATAADVAGNVGASNLSLNYLRPPAVTITSPSNLSHLNISPTTVTGTVDDPTATVVVNAVEAAVADGRFSVALPLLEGPNTITATATSGAGAIGTASLQVTLDTTPPRVTITSPPDQFVTTAESVSVAGSVNDIVVGTVNEQQAQVSVNGRPAQVANRSFLAADVPLAVGPNIIQAVGRDRVGNAVTTQITVTRQALASPQIQIVSGNNQAGAVGSALLAPLVVALTDGDGNPVANKPVIFKVKQNDGLLSSDGAPAPTVIATTDAQGRAQAQWKLGMRAGAGGNAAEAYAVGFGGTALFTATGTQGPAGKIVVDTGNDQIGATNQPLPKPLIAVVVDEGNNRLAGVPVTFSVKAGGGSFNGQPTFTVNTDSDGRAAATLTLGLQEGNANNLVEADFPSNAGAPATFAASGRTPGNPASTTISGVVLDNSNVPIPGVTVRAVLTNMLTANSFIVQSLAGVQTDEQGQFTIPQAPVGFVKLLVDGSTATRPGTYPTLDYDMVTVAGQDNHVGQPIFLLPINSANQLCVTATDGGGTLTIPEAPGFSLTFGPGQVIFPGGSQTGCISATVVHGDKVPMVPGFGQQPRFIVTIQPAGAHFNPPARITLPNVDGLRPREVTEMYSFDHDIGSFVAIGTGTVSDDGRVIVSNPGVGVLKAGWHCGGNPNSTGNAASLNVNLSAASSEATAGSTVDVTANGTPPQDGKYINWEVIDDPADPDDDPTVASFVTTPTCDNQTSCLAKLKGNKIGIASIRVTFICTTTGKSVTSSIVKVKFKLGLKVKEVSFVGGDIDLYRDQSGGAPQVMDPVWKDTNTPEQNNPAAYTKSSTMKVTVKFAVDPAPPSPVSNVTIEGEVPGLGKFVKTGVTIPAAAEVTVSDIAADTPLPDKTKFYDPLTINWRHMADGNSCPKCTEDGSTSHKLYVTLATPTQPQVFLTTLHLAVSSDGATDAKTAFQKTWAQFAGPANVKSWDNRTLYYYRDGVGFNGCALDEEDLLTQPNGSGQCGSWARLLMAALATNGVASEFVEIDAIDGTQFIVKNWTYGTASRPAAPEYKWELIFNPAAISAGDLMVPKQPGNVYGDLTSLSTLAGQNSTPPSEKAFIRHFVVKVTIAGISPSYYDPSYGVTYTNADDFENKAVDGYFTQFGGDPANVFRVKKSTGLKNIKFDK